MSIQDLIEKTKVSFCQDCGVCTGSCPVSRVLPGFSPQQMVAKYVLSSDLGLEDDILEDQDMWSCLACGLCLQRCPSKVDYLEFVRALREEAFSTGKKTTFAHDEILQTIVQMQRGGVPQNRTAWAREAGTIREEGEYYLFVGCLPYFDVLFRDMGVSSLRSASDMLKMLNKLGIEPVVSDEERCCGHDMLWSGNVELFKELASHNVELIKRLGCKKVIFGCPEGYLTFKSYYPLYCGDMGLEAVHFYDLVNDQIQEGAFQMSPLKHKATYHDPCRLGRMAGIYEAPREIISSIPGMELVEMERNRENAVCCGISCWANCSSYSKQMQMDRLKEAEATGADTLITACPKCNIHFSCALSSTEMGLEVKDLTQLIASAMDV
jgi:heterodisulfide reductase subunit D